MWEIMHCGKIDLCCMCVRMAFGGNEDTFFFCVWKRKNKNQNIESQNQKQRNRKKKAQRKKEREMRLHE